MSTLFSEAIKLKDGILYNLEYHQCRVERTLCQFYGTTIELSALNDTIPEYAKTGFYKCRVIYNDRIQKIEFIPYNYRIIQKVGIISDNTIVYDYKFADRTHLNRLLDQSGCDDIIIIKNGMVADSFSSNIVFQSGYGLYTPASCLLHGTKRQYLLDNGIIKEKKISMEDIKKYNRVFFINAMVDLEDGLSVETSTLIKI